MENKSLLMAVAVLSLVSLVACSSPKKESSNLPSSESSSASVVKETTESSSKIKEKISDGDQSPEETKRIGSADYGYVNIPTDWKKYEYEEGGDNIQYIDQSGTNAIILNASNREKANVAEGEEFSAEMMAQRFESAMKGKNKVVKVSRSSATVGGNDAIQVNMSLKSGNYTILWTFKKDDKVYMISCVCDEKTIAQLTTYVKETWSFDGTGAVSD